MKQMMLMTFLGLLLISSCTCNDGEQTVTNEDTMSTGNMDGTTMDENNNTTGTNTTDWATIRLMFDENKYTEEQIKEYRKMHDELDWGNVPGFYPEGSTRPLTTDDTKFLTEWGHKVMTNEIYARHGMKFSDEDLQKHFGNQDWYNAERDNVAGLLTEQEKQNLAFLQTQQP